MIEALFGSTKSYCSITMCMLNKSKLKCSTLTLNAPRQLFTKGTPSLFQSITLAYNSYFKRIPKQNTSKDLRILRDRRSLQTPF